MVDHMDYILSSLDMFANISENLINYTFNVRIFCHSHLTMLSYDYHRWQTIR